MRVKTLGEAFQDIEHGVYDYTVGGKCVGCGNCCSNSLFLSQKEINTIKTYIRNHRIKEQMHMVAPLMNQPVLDLTCPFMDSHSKDKKCVIYPVRPLVCRCFTCNDPNRILNEPVKEIEKLEKINMRETFFGGGKNYGKRNY